MWPKTVCRHAMDRSVRGRRDRCATQPCLACACWRRMCPVRMTLACQTQQSGGGFGRWAVLRWHSVRWSARARDVDSLTFRAVHEEPVAEPFSSGAASQVRTPFADRCRSRRRRAAGRPLDQVRNPPAPEPQPKPPHPQTVPAGQAPTPTHDAPQTYLGSDIDDVQRTPVLHPTARPQLALNGPPTPRSVPVPVPVAASDAPCRVNEGSAAGTSPSANHNADES
jgi:hypothetical protein